MRYTGRAGRATVAAVSLCAMASAVLPAGVAAQSADRPVTISAVPLAEAAASFGALEAVSGISLSPDGNSIAFITPSTGQGNDLYVVGTAEGATPRRVLRARGDPERLNWCSWASNSRIICETFGTSEYAGEIFNASSIVAVDAAGGNVRNLSTRRGVNAIGIDLRGGDVIDQLRADDDAVLMMRSYVPEANVGSNIRSDAEGMGVDRVDVHNASIRRVESARRDAVEYITDGNGNVRIMATQAIVGQTRQLADTVRYLYRPVNQTGWQLLSTVNVLTGEGFTLGDAIPCPHSLEWIEEMGG